MYPLRAQTNPCQSMSWFFKKKAANGTGFNYSRQPVFEGHERSQESALALGLCSSLSVGHSSWASTTAAGAQSWHPGPAVECSGTTDRPALALPRRMLHHPALLSPLAAASLRGEQQQDGEDAALGKTALPVIALESLGILPHKINVGAIMTNLFYTHKTMLGTSPSTGCEAGEARSKELLGAAHPRAVLAPCSSGHPHRSSWTPQRSCMPLQPECKTWRKAAAEIQTLPPPWNFVPQQLWPGAARAQRESLVVGSACASITKVAVSVINTFCSHQLNHLFVAAPSTEPGRFKPIMPCRDSIAATLHRHFVPQIVLLHLYFCTICTLNNNQPHCWC